MAARKNTFHSKVPFLVVEVLGLALSVYLFLVSTELLGKDMLPCGRTKWFACEKIIQGPFSHFGPFSVAAMGVIYYLLHLALTAGLRDRSAQLLKAAIVSGGLAFIAWLRMLEFKYVGKICPWCWGVALLTLIHAGISYSLASPPLPRMRRGTLAASIFVGFVILIGLITLLELGVKSGEMLLNQGFGPTAEVERPARPDSLPAIAKPKVTATPTPTPRPRSTPAPASPVAATPVPTAPPANAAETATPAPPRPQASLPPEPQILDTPETRALRNQGFRHAGSGEDVIAILKVKPPVLLLVYDPFCKDCHNLIMNVLSAPPFAQLPVTKVAIQESMLSGQINEMVKEMPTLILFGPQGDILFSRTGSKVAPEDLARDIRNAIP